MKARESLLALLVAGAAVIAPPRPAAAGDMPRLGVEGGLNLAEITYHADDPSLEPEVSFHPAWWAGATLEVPLTERWSVVSGGRYVEYGEVEDISISGVALFRFHETLRYLAFPVRAQWRPLRGRGLTLAVGPEVGYLASVKWSAEGDVLNLTSPTPGPARPARVTAQIFENAFRHPIDFFYPWNLAATAGASYEIPIGGHKALAHVRYTEGLTDVLRSTAVRRTVRGFEMGAGWRW